MAWLAEVIFFGCYALGYYFGQTVPHNIWGFLSAVAAAVIAVLLCIDNRSWRPGSRTA
jgi:hypothetical protein